MAHDSDPSRLGLKNYQYPDKFGQWLGYKIVSVDRQNHTSELVLEIREDHLSSAQRLHGGVIASLFDVTCGAAVFSTLGENDFCSTVELKVNYFHPIHLHDKLTAKAKVMFRGKKLCVVHGMLYRNGEEKPVAMATGTFNVVSPKSA